MVEGNEVVTQVCYCAGHQFTWRIGAWGGTTCDFDEINGHDGKESQTAKFSKRWLVNGQRYESTVKVRKTGVQAFLNDKPICGMKTDYSDLSLNPQWQLHHDNALGVGAKANTVRFDSIEMIEVTGHGKEIR